MEMLKKVNPALFLVAAIAVKAIAFDVSVAAMLVVVPLLGFEGYKLYLKQKHPEPIRFTVEMQKEIDAIKSKINLLSVEKSIKQPPSRYF